MMSREGGEDQGYPSTSFAHMDEGPKQVIISFLLVVFD